MEKFYFNQSADEALRSQDSAESGLHPEEARRRLEEFGPNQLQDTKKKSPAAIFFSQFKDLLVIILIAAAIISMFSSNVESTIVIFAVIILNAILGTVQTLKAEKSLESLKAMSAPMAKVLRGGERIEIPARDVVPGDILMLEAGDLIAADGRILQNFSLKVNESALTGESESVEKHDRIIDDMQVALGDQRNMVFSGSLVTYGRALVVVTATGMQTELGKIASLMNQTQQRKTPLQVSLDQFSGKLALAILVICALVFVLSIFRSGMNVLDSLMFAVALAVAAIPEALSSIVTIVLAIGTQKMARQNAIIKDLKAVEALGCVSVICSDKTGTLTQNRMTVQKLYADGRLLDCDALDLANTPQRELLKIGLLDSDASTDEAAGTFIGDPTEVALVQIGDRLGVEENTYRLQHPRLCELAFDSDRKLMSTLHLVEGVPTLMTKGALDVLLDRSDLILTSAGAVPLTDEAKADILRTNEQLSREGLRVLAFAERQLDGARELTLEDENHFTFVGLAAMMDPPRPESIQAVADAKSGGIRTVMITGDHKVTAAAIARQIGIFEEGDLAVEGVELDRMTDQELDEKLPHIAVYARVSPEHKIRIVTAWQRRGCIVSMTGDGVNDAPALKKADIGVAMGITGTEVSKDAAAMILSDDNFATIVKAVVNGRGVYTNIKNTIHFLLSGNMAGILSVLFASLAGLPAPFAPVHLLFINLLTDSLPAIAIGMEPAHADLLRQKPRSPKAPILDRALFLQILSQGFLIAVPTMAAFYIGMRHGGGSLAMTMAFATLTLARLFHGFNCRGKQSIFRLGFLTNRYTLLAFLLGVLLLAAVLLLPALHPLFLIADITLADIGLVALLAVVPTVLIQGFRVIRDAVKKDK
jgi:Ca2+-transporting ATPase